MILVAYFILPAAKSPSGQDTFLVKAREDFVEGAVALEGRGGVT